MLSAVVESPSRRTQGVQPVRVARRAVGEVLEAAEELLGAREATAEKVHVLRRSCRAASVVLDVLGSELDKSASEKLRVILRKLRRRAGRVRDLDVHVEIASELLGGEGQPRRLQREIEQERPLYERDLLEYVAKVTPGRLRKLRARLATDVETETVVVRKQVARRAGRWIDRANEVLSRPLPPDAALHDLRIDLKKLRISLRTLRDLGVRGTKRKEEIIAGAARHLGRFHDVATLRERLEARTDAALPEIADLIRRLRIEEGESVVRARDSLRKLRSA
ncbi:MAG: CHAD domain-containing protein [Phycisphaeraceae bacterium]|nr:CHAD domain-containing protein [Phycisphaeraceae bacterium]